MIHDPSGILARERAISDKTKRPAQALCCAGCGRPFAPFRCRHCGGFDCPDCYGVRHRHDQCRPCRDKQHQGEHQ